MKRFLTIGTVLLSTIVTVFSAQEPEWNSALVKPCDRVCLVGVMDAYMNAIYKHDPKLVPPLARDYRVTENTGVMEVGEGMLWRRTMQPTTFNLYIADPTNGQVALQARVMMQGQNTLIASAQKGFPILHLWP